MDWVTALQRSLQMVGDFVSFLIVSLRDALVLASHWLGDTIALGVCELQAGIQLSVQLVECGAAAQIARLKTGFEQQVMPLWYEMEPAVAQLEQWMAATA